MGDILPCLKIPFWEKLAISFKLLTSLIVAL